MYKNIMITMKNHNNTYNIEVVYADDVMKALCIINTYCLVII